MKTRAIQIFEAYLESDETRKHYNYLLKKFANHYKLDSFDSILAIKGEELMKKIEDYTILFNERGTVEKKILTMDLFDAFIMTLHKLKTSRIRIISVNTLGETSSSSDMVCNSCKDGTHSNKNHSMWIEEDEETRVITCKCGKCNP